MSQILLLEPNYKNKYPPLGLMKISAYHKHIGDDVIFAKGKLSNKKLEKTKKWDRIYITTLFTFEWETTIETIKYAQTLADNDKIFIGGITATLMPNEIKEETGIQPIIGRLNTINKEAKKRIGYDDEHVIDNYPPDYEMLNDIDYKYPYQDAYFAFMTRGCGMNCEFCAVGTLEPKYNPYISIKEQIFDNDKDLLLMDNNVLISPKFDEIIEEIIELGYGKENVSYEENHRTGKGSVDFNQGLDANILARNEKKAKLLGKIKIRPARIAFDHIEDKNVYKQAIENCAKYGIKHFSNYMLYNAESFEGKGSKYQADRPEDLYDRIKITLALQENINSSKNDDDKISIYSFPMKYIPLKAKDRSHVSYPLWNEKYLRAIQIMLLPLKGVGGVSEEFFRKAFGEDVDKFKLNIKMPESILMSRGKFLQRDDEFTNDWEKRVYGDEGALIKFKFYNEWIRIYKIIEEKGLNEKFIDVIKDNSFLYKKFLDIDDEIIKKIYLHYLSPNQFLKLLRELVVRNLEKDIKIVYKYTYKDFSLYYDKIIEYISTMKGSYQKLTGFLKVFGQAGSISIIKKWFENDFENEYAMDILKGAMNHIGQNYINITKYKALKRYIDSGCLTSQEEKLAIDYIESLDEYGITQLLKSKFDDFKTQLKIKNKDEPYYDHIEKIIEILTSDLGKQLSLF